MLDTHCEPIPAASHRFTWRYRTLSGPIRILGTVFADDKPSADAQAAMRWPDVPHVLDYAFLNPGADA